MRNPRILVLAEGQDLRRQVDRVASALRPRAEVTACESLDDVDRVIDDDGPFEVIIAGPMASTAAGLQQLRRIHGRAHWAALILAFSEFRRGSIRDTVRTGALDLLKLPVTDDSLLQSIEDVLQMAPPAPAGPARRHAPSDEGIVMAVVSATGGCGKTFFSTNLAYHLESKYRKRTCLLDLDLQFGELSTALRLKPRHTIADLLAAESDDEELGRRLEDYMERHETGVYVLAAPEEPAQADAIDAADVGRVIEAARSRFDFVIIDTPAALSEAVLVGIESAERLFGIATLDLPSVRNLGVMLTTFKQLKIPAERIKLMLNKVEPDVGIDVSRVEKYFPQGFALTIPYGREVNRSLNMGLPVMAYAPRGEVSKTLASGLSNTLLEGLIGEDAEVQAAAAAPRRLRLAWRQRKPA